MTYNEQSKHWDRSEYIVRQRFPTPKPICILNTFIPEEFLDKNFQVKSWQTALHYSSYKRRELARLFGTISQIKK